MAAETGPAVGIEEETLATEQEARGPLTSLGRHTLIYGSGYVATAVVSLVLVPVYTHYFTPSEFGLLALMLVLYGLGKQVYDLGFTNSIARFFFDEETGRDHERAVRRMRVTSLTFLTLYAGVLTAVLSLFAGSWSDLLTGTPVHAGLVRIVSITLFAETIAIVPLTIIRMEERSGVYVTVTLARLVTSLGLSILFVVGLGWGVRGALWANAIPAVGIMIVLLLVDHVNGLRERASRPLLRQMLAFGLPFFPVLLCGWVIDASDRYLLEIFKTRADVGYYSLAYRFAQVMQIAVAAFSMGWAPLRYQIFERPDARAVYRRLTSAYVVLASILAVAIAVFAEEIVHVVAPPSYASAANVIPLLVLAYVLQGLYYLMITGMGVMKRTGPLAWIAALGAIVNVGINLVAIPALGMTGAALTTVLAYAVMVAGSWWASQRVYAIPFDWARIAQVGALGAGVVAVADVFSPSGLGPGAVFALAMWGAFVALLIATHAIDRSEVRALRSTVRGWLGR
jgi:O-antigen/teichoic acid export membrane protein